MLFLTNFLIFTGIAAAITAWIALNAWVTVWALDKWGILTGVALWFLTGMFPLVALAAFGATYG